MRFLITFAYNGSNFLGYQKQKQGRTVQNQVENVLSTIYNEKVLIHASGRTDARVHAYNQKAHFDVEKELNVDKLKNSMNKMLPKDIYIKRIEKVHNHFHARFDVVRKVYQYKINMGEYNPLEYDYVYQYNHSLDINRMKKAIKYLIGEHNFKSFTKTDEKKEDYIRTIYEITITNKDDMIEIEFSGSGFLRYMIRNIVGTLIAVGEGKIEPNYVEKILKMEDRTKAYKTANPEGLYLKDVFYK